MSVIIILIGISLSIAVGFLIMFIWNFRSGQYDDIEAPAFRILFENKEGKAGSKKETPVARPDESQVSD
jgi:cbb3-type cytochrome oxidase maturation protein